MTLLDNYHYTVVHTGFLFKSIGTRNGPTGASFILSTCDLLQVVANEEEFCLIYDTWSLIQSVLVEKLIRKVGKIRF